ncbi:MAG: Hint domain-containing protein [Sulfitobacter sp.]
MPIHAISLGFVQTGGFDGGGAIVSLDPTEGNTDSENASFLNGLTFGTVSNPAKDSIVEMTLNDDNGDGLLWEDDLGSGETFTVGGATYALDSGSRHNIIVTYMDGTTGSGTVAVVQATNGQAFLLPLDGATNAGNDFLDDGGTQGIRSIAFQSVFESDYDGLVTTREANAFVVCFVDGTQIQTPTGERAVEDLCVGDQVVTLEFGPMTVRWLAHRDVGEAELLANEKLIPVRIKPGLFGNKRALLLSKQHCVLVRDAAGFRAYVKAGHLAEQTRIASYATGRKKVSYYHLLLDSHATVFANGLPCESFYPGPRATSVLSPQNLKKLRRVLPDLGRKPVEEVYGRRAARVLRCLEVERVFTPETQLNAV